jgi:peptide/histidine transporter 3/4
MLKRIGIGLVFALCTMVCFAFILHFCPNQNKSNFYYNNALIAPQILYGFTHFLIFATSLEFTIAQTPTQMRSLMIGLWFASMGIGNVVNINLKYAFSCNNEYICYNVYYYITKSGVALIILIAFAFFAKCYKFRVRENEVNIYQIVDDHYDRYMDQANEHYRNTVNISS